MNRDRFLDLASHEQLMKIPSEKSELSRLRESVAEKRTLLMQNWRFRGRFVGDLLPKQSVIYIGNKTGMLRCALYACVQKPEP